MFDDFTPSELQSFWKQQLDVDTESKPRDATELVPESMTAFLGDMWSFTNEKPELRTSVNLWFALWKSFLPKVMAKVPKPSTISKKGNAQYAKLHNEIKSYRDREMGAREQFQDGIQDCFLRGTGALYHDRDSYRGLARSARIPITDIVFDSCASSPKDAKHLIIRHEVRRWEFARLFGPELADKVKPKSEAAKTQIGDKGKPFDIIEYFMAWSKHGKDLRIYPFHRDFADEYLIEEDGRPGEKWPFVFDNEDWPVSLLTFQRNTDSIYGFSYYDAAKGPLHFVQWCISYILAATKKFAHQAIAYPTDMGDIVAKIMSNKSHLTSYGYDRDSLAGRSLDDVFKVIQFPDLNPGLFTALQLSQQTFDVVSGSNAMTMMAPGQVETASESVRLEGQAESRMQNDVVCVEEWMKTATHKEVQIDCALTPRRSVVRVGPAPQKDPQPIETTEAQPGEQLLDDVPYQIALLLEAGVQNPMAGQEQIMAVQQLKAKATVAESENPPVPVQAADPMTGQPVMQMQPHPVAMQAQQAVMQADQEMDPKVKARMQYGIPLDAPCEIVEPGIEAYVTTELAAFWIEHMTPRQIKAEIEIRIQQGSTSKLGHVQEWNEANILFKTCWMELMNLQLYDKAASLWNYYIGSLENYDLDGVKMTPEELAQQMMMIQQQQQQAAEAQAMAEAQSGEAQLKQKEQELGLKKQEFKDKMDFERQKQSQKHESDQQRMRDSRAKTTEQIQLQHMKQVAQERG